MPIVMGCIAVIAGVCIVLLRGRLAARGERILRRRYGALGDEASKHVTPSLYVLGGIACIALGFFWTISSLLK